MKSQQLEIKTNCENCCFAVVTDDKQTGCMAGRLEKFVGQQKASQNENGYFVVNRFCNMQRKENISVEKAYNQIKSNFGIAIFDQDEKYFDTAIESCKNIQYDKDKFKISIHSNKNQRFGRLFNEINEFKKLGIQARLFFDVEEKHISSSEKEVFQYLYGSSHLLKLKTTDSIEPSFLSSINKSLNDDLEIAFTYQSNDIICLPFWIVNQQYLSYNSYDLLVSSILEESINNSMHKKYA